MLALAQDLKESKELKIELMTRKFSIAFLFLVVVLLLLLVAGCSRKAMPSTTIVVKDSIITNTVEKIVRIPGDTVRIEKQLECDPKTNQVKDFKETKEKGVERLTVEVKDGTLKVESDCDSLVKILEKTIQKTHSEKSKIVQQVIEYRSYWLDKYLARPISITVIILLIGWILKQYNNIGKIKIPFIQ